MKASMYITVVSLLAALATPVRMAAQDSTTQSHKHHRYKLIDLGTFGGPTSWVSNPDAKDLNNRGTVQGWADTSVPDPNYPNCWDYPDCFVAHAFQWQNGVLTDLGTLSGGSSSAGAWINDSGVIAGISQNGLNDPLTGFPEEAAVVWQNGQIVDLGTFGGNQGSTAAINNRGQIVGGALNTIPDPYASALTGSFVLFAPAATQARAALWNNGALQDLGTLGGNDAIAMSIFWPDVR